MGVIRRQSIKHSIVNLTGLLVGAVSTLFIYPHVLEEYGLAQTLLTIGVVGLPLLSLGANTVVIRYFPRFEHQASGHHGFLPLLLLMCLTGWLLAVGAISIGYAWLDEWLSGKPPMLRDHIWMAAPLALFFILGTILNQYSANFQRIVIPTILQDFSQKLLLPLLLISVWQQWLTLDQMLWILLLHSVLVTLSLSVYIARLGQWYWKPDWRFLTAGLRQEMGRFIVFGAFGGFAMLIASRIDVLMISSLSTLKNSGVYAIAAYIAAAIDIPTKSLYMVSMPSVAKYLSENNRDALHDLYQKVAINLTLAGLLLFGATWISVDSLFAILPNGDEVAAGKYVILFIGLARILEMITGLNNYLIYLSKYYIYSLVTLCILAVANIGFNLWLIPRMGLTGAAVATLLSVSIYNIVSLILVWNKFRLQPFSSKIGVTLLAAVMSYLAIAWIPRLSWPILDIALHSGLYALVFGLLIWRMHISQDVNELIGHAIKRVKGR